MGNKEILEKVRLDGVQGSPPTLENIRFSGATSVGLTTTNYRLGDTMCYDCGDPLRIRGVNIVCSGCNGHYGFLKFKR